MSLHPTAIEIVQFFIFFMHVCCIEIFDLVFHASIILIEAKIIYLFNIMGQFVTQYTTYLNFWQQFQNHLVFIVNLGLIVIVVDFLQEMMFCPLLDLS